MKTTKAQFNEFVGECKKWITVFGLQDWFIRYEHNDDFPRNLAMCTSWTDSRDATITLTVDIGNSVPEDFGGLGVVAFEEVMHLVFSDMKSLIPQRDKDTCVSYEHAVIARLSNAIYPHRKVICGK